MKLIHITSSKDITEALWYFIPGADINTSHDQYNVPLSIEINANGKKLRIGCDNCGRLQVTFTAPPEKVKKWELTGTLFGSPFKLQFDSKFSAEERLKDIHGGRWVDSEDDVKLEILEIEVEVTP